MKLTEDQKLSICKEYMETRISKRMLGNKYDVCERTIYNIINEYSGSSKKVVNKYISSINNDQSIRINNTINKDDVKKGNNIEQKQQKNTKNESFESTTNNIISPRMTDRELFNRCYKPKGRSSSLDTSKRKNYDHDMYKHIIKIEPEDDKPKQNGGIRMVSFKKQIEEGNKILNIT
jgi:hypothetical protein